MSTVNKVILDYRELKKRVLAHKTLGHKVICTIGSWDMLHIGHLRYLNRARGLGDVLIVGTDSDRGIKTYKGPLRPIIPQEERMEMLTYQDCVTYVTLVDDINKKGEWNYKLIKSIPIDAFVAVEGNSYTKKQLAEISKHCELIVLPRQAEKTSSTDIIQNVLKIHLLQEVGSLKKNKK